MKQYRDLVQKIYNEGQQTTDRTGVGTRSIFAHSMSFDLSEGFPLVTLKKTSFHLIASELLWFLSGSTNTSDLHKENNHIWDEWANDFGDLGPIYGSQWRSWNTLIPFHDDTFTVFKPIQIKIETTDQIANVINTLKYNPTSRRMVVSAWNVSDLDKMALPPCHLLFQFYVRGEHLDCQMYQRSADVFLGVPFNIASYSLLMHMIGHLTGYKPGIFTWVGGDCHLYDNHRKQASELLTRVCYPLPKLSIVGNPQNIDEFSLDNFVLENYVSHAPLKAPIAV